MQHKTCKICGETKPIAEFTYPKNKCKKCFAAWMREHKKKTKDKVYAYNKAYRSREDVKLRLRERDRQKRLADKRKPYSKPKIIDVCPSCLKKSKTGLCYSCKLEIKRKIRHQALPCKKVTLCVDCKIEIGQGKRCPTCSRAYQLNRYKTDDQYKRKILDRTKEYSKKTRPQRLAYERQYLKDRPDKRSAKYRAHENRRRQKSVGSFTAKQWLNLKERYNYTCPKCLMPEPWVKLEVEHVIPITLHGTNYIFNIQPLCHECNAKKHTKIEDYRNEIWLQGISVAQFHPLLSLYWAFNITQVEGFLRGFTS